RHITTASSQNEVEILRTGCGELMFATIFVGPLVGRSVVITENVIWTSPQSQEIAMLLRHTGT
ncbi:unnamed protein product, partial [Allacma fusca]